MTFKKWGKVILAIDFSHRQTYSWGIARFYSKMPKKSAIRESKAVSRKNIS
jgi:hypothetical protein